MNLKFGGQVVVLVLTIHVQWQIKGAIGGYSYIPCYLKGYTIDFM